MNVKYFSLIISFLICISNLYSQNSKQKIKIGKKSNHVSSIDTTIYLGDKIEKHAHYKGGDSLLSKFFLSNFRWKNNSIIQSTINIQICFIVEKNGSRNYYPLPNTLPNRINYDQEDLWLIDSAFSVIKKMPYFEPAKIKEKKVRSSNCIDIIICSNKEIFVQYHAILPFTDGLKTRYFSPCQSDTIDVENFAEQMPEFPGGKDSMELFIQRNLIYPTNAKEASVEGRVQIQFVVWSDGKISQIKTQTHKGWGLEEEAVRVVKMMPQWKPGKQNSKPVNVRFSIPIVFKLQNK